ncbi:hypothetical protein POY22_26990, partial [Klebsiella pneumoniae]
IPESVIFFNEKNDELRFYLFCCGAGDGKRKQVKAGVFSSPRGRGDRGVAFENFRLPPPLDKALHDLS